MSALRTERPQSARVLRQQLEAALDRLLSAVDGVLQDLDAIEPDADLEPSLGFPNRVDQTSAGAGGADDREDEHDGAEPSLGSLDGARVVMVTRRDANGRALRTRLTDPLDQSRWGLTGQDDCEDQCEDEGGQCDDEGHVEPVMVYAPEYWEARIPDKPFTAP